MKITNYKTFEKTTLNKIVLTILFILFSTCLLTISSKIKIQFYPVPMTMQTFIVLGIGITLGPRFGSIVLISYIFEGLIGLPVFAGTPEKGIGITYIIGPTGGYLLGYVVSAYLAGKINFNYSFPIRFFLLVVALSPVYILGLTWLGILFGFDKPLLEWGLVPFVLAEVFKIALLAIFIPKLVSYRKFISNKI
jgi:biotin transport system substrate-specific component